MISATAIDRRTLRVVTLRPEVEMFRGCRTEHAADVFTPPGTGNGRFSPLSGRGHTYLAQQRSAALLESVLHEANGANPRIYAAQLAHHRLVRARICEPVRLVDLRDPALVALGVAPGALTDALPMHYPCTRAVAAALVGTKGTQGFLWTSRQGRLHAERNPDGLASEVLRHRSLDVAVLYEADDAPRIEIVGSEPLIEAVRPTRFVQELANLLRVAIL